MGRKMSDSVLRVVKVLQLSLSGVLVILGDNMKHWETLAVLLLDLK